MYNKLNKFFKYILFATLLSTRFPLFAQDAGDEDKELFNQAKARDQKTIDEAINGWWNESMENHEQRMQWWRDAKFGMFIHWGIYSLPGGEWKGKEVGGYAEHLMRKEKISRAEYLELAHTFNPDKFNADEWVKDAKMAGMKYLIITAKHHDGFAMYDSKVSDFNIMQQTPWKHDPMADLAAACKKYDIKFGFYYSHAFDWEHPDAPGNDWEYKNPGGDDLLGGKNWFDAHPEWLPKAVKYVDEKAIPQIKELILKYHPDILWFDTPHKLPLSENIRILKAIRETDPDVVVNGRLARSASISVGDYKNTSDRPAEMPYTEGDWEAIPTTNESYGYSKYDNSHKSVSFFIRLLAKASAKGGNLLMNIGPMGDGEFDPKDVNILEGIGQWMHKNSSSIYGSTPSPLPFQSWGVSTKKDNLIYLHVFQWPKDGKLEVGGLKSNISKAYLLADDTKTPLSAKTINSKDLAITVPNKEPDSVNTVIVLEMKGNIETDPVRYIVSKDITTQLLAFDAELIGKGFNFGDGKPAKYFVENWKSKDQAVKWHFRTATSAKFNVIIKYTSSLNAGGIYQVNSDNFTKQEQVKSTKNGNVISEQLGVLTLNAGIHDITIKAIDIQKAELMKLLEVQLIPLDNN